MVKLKSSKNMYGKYGGDSLRVKLNKFVIVNCILCLVSAIISAIILFLICVGVRFIGQNYFKWLSIFLFVTTFFTTAYFLILIMRKKSLKYSFISSLPVIGVSIITDFSIALLVMTGIGGLYVEDIEIIENLFPSLVISLLVSVPYQYMFLKSSFGDFFDNVHVDLTIQKIILETLLTVIGVITIFSNMVSSEYQSFGSEQVMLTKEIVNDDRQYVDSEKNDDTVVVRVRKFGDKQLSEEKKNQDDKSNTNSIYLPQDKDVLNKKNEKAQEIIMSSNIWPGVLVVSLASTICAVRIYQYNIKDRN